MSKSKGPFHVVAHRYDDRLITCSVYLNNRPYLKPPSGETMSRRAAHAVCSTLNGLKWPEMPLTREQLLAVR